MYENYFLPPYSSTNAVSQNFSINFIPPKIEEYEDGILIDFGGSPYIVEYYDAMVQIWRDRKGNIVALDIIFSKEGVRDEPSK
ncbi:MAG: hypothetical protein QXV69_08795 [Sulfolobaceae archaeon]